MPPQRVNPASLYGGVPYDYATVAPAGGIVFTAGACPLDAEGSVVAPGDLEAQAHRTLDNLEVALAAAGSAFEQVLKTTVYVAVPGRSELVRVFDVVEQRFAPRALPAPCSASASSAIRTSWSRLRRSRCAHPSREPPRARALRSGPVSRKLVISAPTGSSGLPKGDAQRLG